MQRACAMQMVYICINCKAQESVSIQKVMHFDCLCPRLSVCCKLYKNYIKTPQVCYSYTQFIFILLPFLVNP